MQSPAKVESSVAAISVSRDIIAAQPREGTARWRYTHGQDNRAVKDPLEQVPRGESSVAGLLSTLRQVVGRIVGDRHLALGLDQTAARDTSWAINQATGGLPISMEALPDGSIVPPDFDFIDDGWFHDPLVDCPPYPAHLWQQLIMGENATVDFIPPPADAPGVAIPRVPLIPELPSLCRRPGIIELGPCDYYLDEPIYLYPGQVLRGAGVQTAADGTVTGGTRLILRGPRAALIVGRRVCADEFASAQPTDRQGPISRTFSSQRFSGDGTYSNAAQACTRLAFRPCERGERPEELPREDVPGWVESTGIPWTTSAILERFAVVDERQEERCERGALDLRAVQQFAVRGVTFVGRGAGDDRAAVTLGIEVVCSGEDPGAYFNHLADCRFLGWSQAIRAYRANSTRVDACVFELADGAVGLDLAISGTITLRGCEFVGPPNVGMAIGIDLRSAQKRGAASGACIPSPTTSQDISVRGCRFSGRLKPMRAALLPFSRGGWFTSAGNEIVPAVGAKSAESLMSAIGPVPFAMGDDLLDQNGPTAAIFADIGEHAATSATAVGSANLLPDPEFQQITDSGGRLAVRAGDQAPEFATGQATWSRWHWNVVDGYPTDWESRLKGDRARIEGDCGPINNLPFPDPSGLVKLAYATGGPAGPGMSSVVRIELADYVAGLRRLDDKRACLFLQQFIVPSDYRLVDDTEISGALAALRVSNRIAGRVANVSCWVRTNVPPSLHRIVITPPPDSREKAETLDYRTSGVDVELLAKMAPGRTHRGPCTLARSNAHSGSGHWEVLAGVGAVPTKRMAYTGGSTAGGLPSYAVVRFALRMLIDATFLESIERPYVELSTPFLGTGMFAMPPRGKIMTEAGGRFTGPVSTSLGPLENITLLSNPGAAHRLVSARSILGAVVRPLAADVAPKLVELLNARNETLGVWSGEADGRMTVPLSLTVPAGDQLRVETTPANSRVAVGLALKLPASDRDAPQNGY